MPVRATKRGADRTAAERRFDVVVCGASFAGLAVARELRATGPLIVLDRYEIGERQTSACAAPTRGRTTSASRPDPADLRRARLPHADDLGALAAAVDVLHLRLPAAVRAAVGAARRRDRVRDRQGLRPHRRRIHTDRGDVSAELIVDALGWRRLLDPDATSPRPRRMMSRGLEVHPAGTGTTSRSGSTRATSRPATAGRSRPATRSASAWSFEPRHHVKQPTVRLAGDLGLPPDGYQGNWIPHAIRPAAADGVFFVGDSAGPASR